MVTEMIRVDVLACNIVAWYKNVIYCRKLHLWQLITNLLSYGNYGNRPTEEVACNRTLPTNTKFQTVKHDHAQK
jgi:hypothetical protein